ncbi:MAG: tRNA (guanosine(37)-N1)-methyltransferase TrmD [Campylobacterales bacterium]
MKFSFVGVFPELIESYFKESIIKKAIDKGIIEIELLDLKNFSTNRYNRIDRAKIGGGAGMVFEAPPIKNALEYVIKHSKSEPYIVIPTPVAKPFKSSDAKRLAKKEHIVFINSRYEGIDERVVERYANEVFSLGDFILSGGEIASLAFFDATMRFIPSVLGNVESLVEESFENSLLEAPSFTKPDVFEGLGINSAFYKGNHGSISSLKFKMAEAKSRFYRPDLYKNINFKDKK